MKTTCLLLTLLFVIGLAACSKSDDPLPEKVFQDVNKTAEDYLAEEPDLEDYYNFSGFRTIAITRCIGLSIRNFHQEEVFIIVVLGSRLRL